MKPRSYLVVDEEAALVVQEGRGVDPLRSSALRLEGRHSHFKACSFLA